MTLLTLPFVCSHVPFSSPTSRMGGDAWMCHFGPTAPEGTSLALPVLCVTCIRWTVHTAQAYPSFTCGEVQRLVGRLGAHLPSAAAHAASVLARAQVPLGVTTSALAAAPSLALFGFCHCTMCLLRHKHLRHQVTRAASFIRTTLSTATEEEQTEEMEDEDPNGVSQTTPPA